MFVESKFAVTISRNESLLKSALAIEKLSEPATKLTGGEKLSTPSPNRTEILSAICAATISCFPSLLRSMQSMEEAPVSAGIIDGEPKPPFPFPRVNSIWVELYIPPETISGFPSLFIS